MFCTFSKQSIEHANPRFYNGKSPFLTRRYIFKCFFFDEGVVDKTIRRSLGANRKGAEEDKHASQHGDKGAPE